MKLNYHGKEIKVDIIGGFEFNNKKYAVCTYNDIENQKIVIVETFTDDTGMHTKDIPDDEVNKVIEYFNLIKEKLMEETDE